MWFEIHDVTSAQPGQEAVVLLVFGICNLQKRLLCLFEFLRCSRGKPEVPVEVVIVDEVWLDGSQIHQYIIELLLNEEALGHALPTWDGITL